MWWRPLENRQRGLKTTNGLYWDQGLQKRKKSMFTLNTLISVPTDLHDAWKNSRTGGSLYEFVWVKVRPGGTGRFVTAAEEPTKPKANIPHTSS